MRTRPTRSHRAVVAFSAVAMLAVALPATAQDAPAGGAQCYNDAPADVRRHDDDTIVDQPRADILEFCLGAGPQAVLSVRLDQVTDPAVDSGWQNATFLGWFLDTDGDGHGDFYVDVSYDPSVGPEYAQVFDIRGDQQQEPTCIASTEVTASSLAVTGIEADNCLDGHSAVAADVAIYYDNGTVRAYDRAQAPDGTAPVDLDALRDVLRHEGTDRYETSVAISRAEFADAALARNVYLARGDVFADAVAGGVLVDGPILVVPPCGVLPPLVASEIERVDPERVVALGGSAAICDQQLARAADGRPTSRLFGPTRFETSVAIGRAAFPDDAPRVYLARGDDFADAVTGGVLRDGPIFLVPRCSTVPAGVSAAIEDLDPDRVVALGGAAAVCDSTLVDAANGRPTGRLFGSNRYETAIAVAQYAFPDPKSAEVYLARGDVLIDGLAGGVLTGGPILLTTPCGDFGQSPLIEVGLEITRNAPARIVGLGGSAAICDETLNQAGGF